MKIGMTFVLNKLPLWLSLGRDRTKQTGLVDRKITELWSVPQTTDTYDQMSQLLIYSLMQLTLFTN